MVNEAGMNTFDATDFNRLQDLRGIAIGRPLGFEPEMADEDYIAVEDADFVDDLLEASIQRLCCSPWSLHPKPSHGELECLLLTQHAGVRPSTMMRRFRQFRGVGDLVLAEVCQPYHQGPSIRSIGHAVATLGVAGLRQPILEASLRRVVFRGAGGDGLLERLFVHSLAVAKVAEAIARDFAQDPAAMREAALFHDVGVAVAFRQLLEERESIGVSSQDEMSIGVASVRGVLTIECAENWRLGATAHSVLMDLERSRDAVDLHPGVPVVVLAEQLALRCGYGVGCGDAGFAPHDTTNVLELAWARNALGIGSAAMEALEARAGEVLSTLA